MVEITILSPGPEGELAGRGPMAARSGRLEGAVIGLVNNSWRCMDVISAELSRVLIEEHGVAEVIEERISAAQTLPTDRLESLASRCSAAIVGIGN